MDKDNQQEGKVLNRIIRCTEAGWEIEADPRHAELVIEKLARCNYLAAGRSACALAMKKMQGDENPHD